MSVLFDINRLCKYTLIIKFMSVCVILKSGLRKGHPHLKNQYVYLSNYICDELQLTLRSGGERVIAVDCD